MRSIITETTVIRAVVAGIVLATGLAGTARAEPQILGVIASAAPVPLQCLRDDCFAEFSAFCLQRTYGSPQIGTPYKPADPSMVSLVGITAGGNRIALPVATTARITALRGHSAIKLSVTRTAFLKHGVIRIEATIAPRAALLPVGRVGLGKPQTPQSIADAVGPLRLLAESMIDNGGPQIEAALLTSRMANALPPGGRVDSATRKAVWNRVMQTPRARRLSPAAIAMAKRAHDLCLTPWQSMRTCLSSHHDMFIGALNNQFWDETRRMF